MCKVRLTHDDVWTCPSKLDCALHGNCLQQVHKGYHACAPYPGAPNYKVPARYHENYYILANFFTLMRHLYEKDTGV